MNIHEFQAKQIFKTFDVPVLEGYHAETPEQAEKAAEKLSSDKYVVKAQIHAGGRGKAGGVKIVSSPKEVHDAAQEMLGKTLVTHQTGPEGKTVKKLYVEAAANITGEFYLGITLDRQQSMPVMMASTEGGVEIEKVAEETTEKILKATINPLYGLQAFQIREMAFGLGLTKEQMKHFGKFAAALYNVYIENDASLIEINPLALLDDDRLIALDAKMGFDDNALFRQKEIVEMRDFSEEEPTETEADKYGMSYVKLDGNVGCMVNGAGLAMSTMDIIKYKGGEPANFLDVGGGASAETVAKGMEIILNDSAVKAIFINIFGGIVRCDRIANGIIQATQHVDIPVPVVVRLDGTNAHEAMDILKNSEIPQLVAAKDLNEGAEKVVHIVKN
ncbi:MAG: ADP-forming succinate--CoA ligase subunit beta [Candidatus Delongbacteria bacterium]|jgi:succinyl-CoA synthetase beta subunit|nr:ADP-forming succinate--CoA ligase subunit beta [Candidatus Delongbacteria bacterium]